MLEDDLLVQTGEEDSASLSLVRDAEVRSNNFFALLLRKRFVCRLCGCETVVLG